MVLESLKLKSFYLDLNSFLYYNQHFRYFLFCELKVNENFFVFQLLVGVHTNLKVYPLLCFGIYHSFFIVWKVILIRDFILQFIYLNLTFLNNSTAKNLPATRWNLILQIFRKKKMKSKILLRKYLFFQLISLPLGEFFRLSISNRGDFVKKIMS